MSDPAEDRTIPLRARPRRARRFVLPDTGDDRTAARIVAFLDGPAAAGQRRGAARARTDRPRRPRELDTRPDWTAAFQQEASRHARYGRPASVLLIELASRPDGQSPDRVARMLADLIREGVRATDRPVRLGPSSFRLLLPETNARAAHQAGGRLAKAFERTYDGQPVRAELRIEVAAPTRGGSLEDALAEAERRLAG